MMASFFLAPPSAKAVGARARPAAVLRKARRLSMSCTGSEWRQAGGISAKGAVCDKKKASSPGTAGPGLIPLCRSRAWATLVRPPPEIPMSRAATEYRYEKLTWPEINDAIELGKVCIVPCGAVEQHGPHLPLDVDLVCPVGIATGAGRAIP